MTVKHIEPKHGHEYVTTATDVQYTPNEGVRAFGCPGPDSGARVGGVISFSDGRVYVMNDLGKTVASYDLESGSQQGGLSNANARA